MPRITLLETTLITKVTLLFPYWCEISFLYTRKIRCYNADTRFGIPLICQEHEYVRRRVVRTYVPAQRWPSPPAEPWQHVPGWLSRAEVTALFADQILQNLWVTYTTDWKTKTKRHSNATQLCNFKYVLEIIWGPVPDLGYNKFDSVRYESDETIIRIWDSFILDNLLSLWKLA